MNLWIVILFLTSCVGNEEHLLKKASRLHNSMLTIDTHCDTPMSFSDSTFNLGVRHNEGCVDIPRMKEGGLDCEFFAIFISQGPRDSISYNKVHKKTIDTFKTLYKNVLSNSDKAGIATSVKEAIRLKKSGKVSVFIGIENGYSIGKDLSKIKEYYNLGARYITLSHSNNNDICDSSTDPAGPENNGLSEFGVSIVNEMNNLGMIVDVSHISDKSFYDVLKVTRSPVLASHSSCRALCGSPRNLTDDMLLALKENGGVIQICILSNFIKPSAPPSAEMIQKLKKLEENYGEYKMLSSDKKREMRNEYDKITHQYEKLASVKDVVDHIDHVVQVIGIDYVGIGTDFDGGGGVEGCRNVSEIKNITVELLRRGYSSKDIAKIWGGNFIRVMQKSEENALH